MGPLITLPPRPSQTAYEKTRRTIHALMGMAMVTNVKTILPEIGHSLYRAQVARKAISGLMLTAVLMMTAILVEPFDAIKSV